MCVCVCVCMCVCMCELLSGGLVSAELLFYLDIKEGGGYCFVNLVFEKGVISCRYILIIMLFD